MMACQLLRRFRTIGSTGLHRVSEGFFGLFL